MSPKPVGLTLCWPQISVHNYVAIHPTVFEIFQWRADRSSHHQSYDARVAKTVI